MADGVEVDYASVRAAADEIEGIPADLGVTSLWLDYDGDFGHEGLQNEASGFLARWQVGGRQMELAHTGIAADLRQTRRAWSSSTAWSTRASASSPTSWTATTDG